MRQLKLAAISSLICPHGDSDRARQVAFATALLPLGCLTRFCRSIRSVSNRSEFIVKHELAEAKLQLQVAVLRKPGLCCVPGRHRMGQACDHAVHVVASAWGRTPPSLMSQILTVIVTVVPGKMLRWNPAQRLAVPAQLRPLKFAYFFPQNAFSLSNSETDNRLTKCRCPLPVRSCPFSVCALLVFHAGRYRCAAPSVRCSAVRCSAARCPRTSIDSIGEGSK